MNILSPFTTYVQNTIVISNLFDYILKFTEDSDFKNLLISIMQQCLRKAPTVSHPVSVLIIITILDTYTISSVSYSVYDYNIVKSWVK